MAIRRVVTGHDANGKAVFASDEEVEPITLALLPGTEFYRMWGADKPRPFPDDGSAQSSHNYFPPVGGIRFGLFTVAADSVSMLEDLDMEAAVGERHSPCLAEPVRGTVRDDGHARRRKPRTGHTGRAISTQIRLSESRRF